MTGENTNDSDFERQLRASLHRDAERVNPRDRRTANLAMVHDDTHIPLPPPRPSLPLAPSATVAPYGPLPLSRGA